MCINECARCPNLFIRLYWQYSAVLSHTPCTLLSSMYLPMYICICIGCYFIHPMCMCVFLDNRNVRVPASGSRHPFPARLHRVPTSTPLPLAGQCTAHAQPQPHTTATPGGGTARPHRHQPGSTPATSGGGTGRRTDPAIARLLRATADQECHRLRRQGSPDPRFQSWRAELCGHISKSDENRRTIKNEQPRTQAI